MPQSARLFVISDGKGNAGRLLQTAMSLAPAIDGFILREKQWTARQMWEWGTALLSAGFPPEKLIINDRLDVALALSIGGVHLAGHSLPPAAARTLVPPSMTLGVSVHSLEEGRAAVEAGADYVLFGHIFPTPSKPGLPGRGLSALQEMASRLSIPVIAVGGIQADNAADVFTTGCAGIAVISAVMAADDPLEAAITLRRSIQPLLGKEDAPCC